MLTTLPKPNSAETEADFVKRFTKDRAVSDVMPSQIDRSLMALLAWKRADNAMSITGWPKRYECRFIEPGLVRYRDAGTVLVTKDFLDRIANSIVGKPVIDETHRDAQPEDFGKGAFDGIVSRVWYNAADGWYWAEFLVWNAVAQKHCEDGAYSVSCAYDVTDHKAVKGLHNNIPYDKEVVGGAYNHLAIVANPRYERARIVVSNSQEGDAMKFFFWQKDKKELRNQLDDTQTIDIDGVAVPLKDAVAKAKAAPKLTNDLKDDMEIEIEGETMTVAQLKDKYRNALKLEADAEDAEKKKAADKDHEDGKHKESPFENCLKCQNAKDEATRLKNEADAAAKAEADRLAKEKGDKHFNALDTAANGRGPAVTPTVVDRDAKAALGKERYGSPEPAAK